jgi:hypothetical protein
MTVTSAPVESGVSFGPDLEPCAGLVDFLRTGLTGLDQRIGTLAQARQALHGYLDAAEQALGT